MDVPNLFAAAVTDQSTKRYLALLVTEDAVQAGLWEVAAGALRLLVISSVQEYTDHDHLVVQADVALQELGTESESVDEVVFGLPSEWVEPAGVVDIKKPILKKLTQDLSLKPAGFVVVTEALAQQLQRDGLGVHSLILWYQKEWLTVALVQKGVVRVCERIGRSHESVSDVQEAVAQLATQAAGKQLPSKVLLVSLAESDEALIKEQRALTGYEWEKQSSFLQPPIFEILPQEKILQAVVGEGGAAVAAAQGLTIINRSLEPSAPELLSDGTTASGEARRQPEEEPSQELESADNDISPTLPPMPVVPTPTQSLTEQQERAHAQLIAGVTSHDNIRQPEPTQASTFGIPIKASYTDDGVMPQDSQASSYSAVINKYDAEDELIEPTVSPSHRGVVLPTWFSSHWHAVVVGLITGAVALVVLAVGGVVFTKQALVQVVLATKTVSSDVEITLDPTLESSDLERQILKAELVDLQVTGSKTADTTGVKLVGEKASGTVSLLNKTSAPKTFPKGTVLQVGKKVFLTTQEITVASASAKENSSGDAETKVYGKADVSIQAKEIGAESNVTKDTEFEVDSFANSSFSAKATTEVTGGSSREVRVASKEDQADLLTALKQELVTQAQKQLSDTAGNGRYIVPTGKVTVDKTSYDSELGDEVKTLTLEATVRVFAVAYQSDDLKPLVAQVLQDQIPSGFVLSEDEPSILSAPADGASSSAKVKLSANVAAVIKPVVDFTSLKKEIAGQSVSSAQAILAGKAEIKASDIAVSPWLTRFITPALPGAVEKITIEEVSELTKDE